MRRRPRKKDGMGATEMTLLAPPLLSPIAAAFAGATEVSPDLHFEAAVRTQSLIVLIKSLVLSISHASKESTSAANWARWAQISGRDSVASRQSSPDLRRKARIASIEGRRRQEAHVVGVVEIG